MDKIIILTPVKNEDWILDIFLSTCSTFADAIIITDQGSTDSSLNIIGKYEKVILIENKNKDFNEDERQIQLIETARKLFPYDKRILIALDADEIMSANVLYSKEFDTIKNAEPGTNLYFEKPTFKDSIKKVIREKGDGFPLGYIDDGKPHYPSKIHSSRLPKGSKRIILHELKVLHYGLIRPNAIAAKLRFYSCLENINRTKSLFQRRISYPQNLTILADEKLVEETEVNWLAGYIDKGIDVNDFATYDFFWHDYEVLSFFSTYGFKKFYNEDIWYFDWNSTLKFYKKKESLIDLNSVILPSKLWILLMKAITILFNKLKKANKPVKKMIALIFK